MLRQKSIVSNLSLTGYKGTSSSAGRCERATAAYAPAASGGVSPPQRDSTPACCEIGSRALPLLRRVDRRLNVLTVR
jgi:hypothetical protein